MGNGEERALMLRFGIKYQPTSNLQCYGPLEVGYSLLFIYRKSSAIRVHLIEIIWNTLYCIHFTRKLGRAERNSATIDPLGRSGSHGLNDKPKNLHLPSAACTCSKSLLDLFLSFNRKKAKTSDSATPRRGRIYPLA